MHVFIVPICSSCMLTLSLIFNNNKLQLNLLHRPNLSWFLSSVLQDLTMPKPLKQSEHSEGSQSWEEEVMLSVLGKIIPQ